MARKCSVCSKNAETLLTSANAIGDSILCMDCYGKIPSYSPRETFKTLEEVITKEEKVLEELENANFPESVRKDYIAFYQSKKEPFEISKTELRITTTPNFEGHSIKKYKGIVSGEVVLGTGFLSS